MARIEYNEEGGGDDYILAGDSTEGTWITIAGKDGTLSLWIVVRDGKTKTLEVEAYVRGMELEDPLAAFAVDMPEGTRKKRSRK